MFSAVKGLSLCGRFFFILFHGPDDVKTCGLEALPGAGYGVLCPDLDTDHKNEIFAAGRHWARQTVTIFVPSGSRWGRILSFRFCFSSFSVPGSFSISFSSSSPSLMKVDLPAGPEDSQSTVTLPEVPSMVFALARAGPP